MTPYLPPFKTQAQLILEEIAAENELLTKEVEALKAEMATRLTAALGLLNAETQTEAEINLRNLEAKLKEQSGESVAWNQVQICTWIGNQLIHNPSMFERNEVCRYVRSLGRDKTLAKHTHPPHNEQVETLRRDAERYRWLVGGQFICDRIKGTYSAWNGEDGVEGFNKVLDAARKGEE